MLAPAEPGGAATGPESPLRPESVMPLATVRLSDTQAGRFALCDATNRSANKAVEFEILRVPFESVYAVPLAAMNEPGKKILLGVQG